MQRLYRLLGILITVAVSVASLYIFCDGFWVKYSVSERLYQYGEKARQRLVPYFQAAGITYPPRKVVLVGLKQERRLELFAGKNLATLRFIRAYPILAASGTLGPKLREGDRQVPEGLYGIDGLNPNSRFHLSLRINYPNAFDRTIANAEGRSNLGGDIFIHGWAVSVGCLAVGNEVAEDLFVLVAETGQEAVEVILSPLDFRVSTLNSETRNRYPWTDKLYRQIEQELRKLPLAQPLMKPVDSGKTLSAPGVSTVSAADR